MPRLQHRHPVRRASGSVAAAGLLVSAAPASAVVVIQWNEISIQATKGFDGKSGSGVGLNSNRASRIHAIEGRAVFDAANAMLHFSPDGYCYEGLHSGSAEAAVAQAAHDALLGLLPDPASDSTADARWTRTRELIILD